MQSSFPPYQIPTFEKWNDIATFYHPLMAGSIDGTDTVPHDHGVVRAIYSKYKPNQRVSGDPLKSIMVRHLSIDTKEATIQQVFQNFGHVLQCRLIRDVISGKSKGYAFVQFEHEADAVSAVRESKDILIDRSKVVVDFEIERTLQGWIPRRFGGGFGGKKESGQLRFGGIERPFRKPIPVNSKILGGTGKGVKRSFREIVDKIDSVKHERKQFRVK